jgi:hypothetical protein
MDSVRHCTDFPLKDGEQFKLHAQTMGRDPTEQNNMQREHGKTHGVNFYSEIWCWPGALVNNVLANDFMHCEVQGESQKHFLKVLSYIFIFV